MSEIICTRCGSTHCKKNGHIHNGKQNHRCKDCERQFVMDDKQKIIPEWIRPMILKALLERLFLKVEADKMWGFVGNKNNKQWILIAIDVHTRQVIAFHIGSRDKDAARKLWQKIPEAYKQHAEFYTDLYDTYVGVIPEKRHHRVSKQSDALQSH